METIRDNPVLTTRPGHGEPADETCQCPAGRAACRYEFTQEDFLCDECRVIHKPGFDDGWFYS